jgi:hypothetical protein
MCVHMQLVRNEVHLGHLDVCNVDSTLPLFLYVPVAGRSDLRPRADALHQGTNAHTYICIYMRLYI